MKCPEARRLAFRWYQTHSERDKQEYLYHRSQCVVCKLEFIRENKRMEQNETDYDDSVFDEVMA